MRTAFPSPRYTLSTALPGRCFCLEKIDVLKTSQSVDLINIMCYDFCGHWSPMTGHHSQLYMPSLPDCPASMPTCVSAIKYFKGHAVPTKKLQLGIPLYGRAFSGATGICQQFTVSGGHNGIFQYYELPGPGVKEDFDRYAGAATCIRSDGGFVSYDNPTSVSMKAKFVKENRLAGLFFWEGTGDVDGDTRSLILAGYLSLHNNVG